jgi:chorismate synthase
MALDGLPAGELIDEKAIGEEMRRRAPGSTELGSARGETDEPVFLSGLLDGYTTGAPVSAIVRNSDVDSSGYDADLPRPSHADLAAFHKFGGFADLRGGGPFSGRLTAPMVLAGALCRQILERRGISIEAKVIQVGPYRGPELDNQMRKEILDARAAGDSVGSVVRCTAFGAPPGAGGLLFGGMESRIAAMLFAIPGVKGVAFGDGFSLSEMRGSAANDSIRAEDGRYITETNRSGGLNGGLTNGMPITVDLALRTTPSIAREQRTVSLSRGENTTLRIRGRHDPCLGPRVVPVAAAVLAICLLDAMLDDGAALLKNPMAYDR